MVETISVQFVSCMCCLKICWKYFIVAKIVSEFRRKSPFSKNVSDAHWTRSQEVSNIFVHLGNVRSAFVGIVLRQIVSVVKIFVVKECCRKNCLCPATTIVRAKKPKNGSRHKTNPDTEPKIPKLSVYVSQTHFFSPISPDST